MTHPHHTEMSVIITVITSLMFIRLCDCGVPDAAHLSYVKQGDFKIGGIFPLNLEGISACGSVPTLTTIQLIEAMAYAVDTVNNDNDLLPNVTVGFDIRDDCFAEDTALWAALSLIDIMECDVSGKEPDRPPRDLLGLVGPLTSTQNVVVGAICDLLEVPTISFGATSDELSDKSRFEFFSRAVPPDSHQSEALADLLKYFNWKYVSLVYFANTYGIQASHAFQNFATEKDICIALSAPVRSVQTKTELQELAEALFRNQKAKVVVMFVGTGTANEIISTLQDTYPVFASVITWIGSEYWGHTMSPGTDDILPIGGIFVNFFLPAPADFQKYFTELSPETLKANPWFDMYVHQEGGIETIGNYVSSGLGGLAASVIDSVFAFAHALDSLLRESCSDMSNNCLSQVNVTGRQLLGFIRNTSFKGTRGQFKLDSNGDLNGKYVLKNLQILETGEAALVDIAVWDALNTSQKLTIYPDKIKWFNGSAGEAPRSICEEECQAGYIVVPLEEKCCWGCRKCQNNEIVLNQTECKVCDDIEWPNKDFTICEPIAPSLLGMQHPVLISIIMFSCLGVVLCILITLGLINYYHHPQVKASSRELSVFNIIGLQLGFLGIFLLLLKPTSASCMIVHAVISLSFTLIYAPTLLKVSRIYRIFDAGKKSTKRPKWIGPKEQSFFGTVLLIIQVNEKKSFKGACSDSILIPQTFFQT